jgi:hypothetical protein
MTEGVGTQKSWSTLRSRFIVENVAPRTTEGGGVMVSLRPEWDETIPTKGVPQLIEKHNTTKTLLRIEVLNPDLVNFFELGKPVYLEITKG